MERQTRDARAESIHRAIYEALGRWRARGWIHDWRIHAGSDASDPLAQRVNLELRLPGGRTRGYSISGDEIEMGGFAALGTWFGAIDHDLQRLGEYDRMQVDMARMAINPPPIVGYDLAPLDRLRALVAALPSPTIDPRRLFETLYGGNPDWFQSPYDDGADRKAEELFIATAGKAAYETLQAGKGLPLKGSHGTDYHLFKRASFCVERPSDGAKLCAVVPGVPLWDHLLGIKLMVEHDEPTFLKTANVSGARSFQSFAVPSASMIWRQREEMARQLREASPLLFSEVNDPSRW